MSREPMTRPCTVCDGTGLLTAEHGTAGAYTNWGCRCVDCRAAAAAHKRAYRERLDPKSPECPHGTTNAYTNWGCRCADCRAANTAYARARRERLT